MSRPTISGSGAPTESGQGSSRFSLGPPSLAASSESVHRRASGLAGKGRRREGALKPVVTLEDLREDPQWSGVLEALDELNRSRRSGMNLLMREMDQPLALGHEAAKFVPASKLEALATELEALRSVVEGARNESQQAAGELREAGALWEAERASLMAAVSASAAESARLTQQLRDTEAKAAAVQSTVSRLRADQAALREEMVAQVRDTQAAIQQELVTGLVPTIVALRERHEQQLRTALAEARSLNDGLEATIAALEPRLAAVAATLQSAGEHAAAQQEEFQAALAVQTEEHRGALRAREADQAAREQEFLTALAEVREVAWKAGHRQGVAEAEVAKEEALRSPQPRHLTVLRIDSRPSSLMNTPVSSADGSLSAIREASVLDSPPGRRSTLEHPPVLGVSPERAVAFPHMDIPEFTPIYNAELVRRAAVQYHQRASQRGGMNRLFNRQRSCLTAEDYLIITQNYVTLDELVFLLFRDLGDWRSDSFKWLLAHEMQVPALTGYALIEQDVAHNKAAVDAWLRTVVNHHFGVQHVSSELACYLDRLLRPIVRLYSNGKHNKPTKILSALMAISRQPSETDAELLARLKSLVANARSRLGEILRKPRNPLSWGEARSYGEVKEPLTAAIASPRAVR